jgi:hypothetical protein
MTRITREALERKLEQARRLALEPTDPLTRERLAQMVEELEFQLQDQRKVAWPPPAKSGIRGSQNFFGGRFSVSQ